MFIKTLGRLDVQILGDTNFETLYSRHLTMPGKKKLTQQQQTEKAVKKLKWRRKMLVAVHDVLMGKAARAAGREYEVSESTIRRRIIDMKQGKISWKEMVQSCCVSTCPNECTKGSLHSFHKFPFKMPTLMSKWITNVGAVGKKGKGGYPTKYHKVCSAHFVEADYCEGRIKPKLKEMAVPSVFTTTNKLAPPKKITSKKLQVVIKPPSKKSKSNKEHSKTKKMIFETKTLSKKSVRPEAEAENKKSPVESDVPECPPRDEPEKKKKTKVSDVILECLAQNQSDLAGVIVDGLAKQKEDISQIVVDSIIRHKTDITWETLDAIAKTDFSQVLLDCMFACKGDIAQILLAAMTECKAEISLMVLDGIADISEIIPDDVAAMGLAYGDSGANSDGLQQNGDNLDNPLIVSDIAEEDDHYFDDSGYLEDSTQQQTFEKIKDVQTTARISEAKAGSSLCKDVVRDGPEVGIESELEDITPVEVEIESTMDDITPVEVEIESDMGNLACTDRSRDFHQLSYIKGVSQPGNDDVYILPEEKQDESWSVESVTEEDLSNMSQDLLNSDIPPQDDHPPICLDDGGLSSAAESTVDITAHKINSWHTDPAEIPDLIEPSWTCPGISSGLLKEVPAVKRHQSSMFARPRESFKKLKSSFDDFEITKTFSDLKQNLPLKIRIKRKMQQIKERNKCLEVMSTHPQNGIQQTMNMDILEGSSKLSQPLEGAKSQTIKQQPRKRMMPKRLLDFVSDEETLAAAEESLTAVEIESFLEKKSKTKTKQENKKNDGKDKNVMDKESKGTLAAAQIEPLVKKKKLGRPRKEKTREKDGVEEKNRIEKMRDENSKNGKKDNKKNDASSKGTKVYDEKKRNDKTKKIEDKEKVKKITDFENKLRDSVKKGSEKENQENEKKLAGELKITCPVCKKHFIDESLMKSHLSEHLYYDTEANTILLRLPTVPDQSNLEMTRIKQQYDLRKQIECMRKNKLLRKKCADQGDKDLPECDQIKKETVEEAVPFTTSLVTSTEFTYKCDLCSVKFMRTRELSQHRNLRHNIRDKMASATCEICSQTFKRGYMLQYHMLTHVNEDVFKCNICHVNLANPTTLKMHKKLHDGSKKVNKHKKLIRCNVCGKFLSTLGKLQIHMVVHNREGPIICGMCPRQFVTMKSFYNHKYTHKFEKPFVCKMCGSAFIRSQDLKVHNYRAHVKTTLAIHDSSSID